MSSRAPEPEPIRRYFVDEAGDPTLFNKRGACDAWEALDIGGNSDRAVQRTDRFQHCDERRLMLAQGRERAKINQDVEKEEHVEVAESRFGQIGQGRPVNDQPPQTLPYPSNQRDCLP